MQGEIFELKEKKRTHDSKFCLIYDFLMQKLNEEINSNEECNSLNEQIDRNYFQSLTSLNSAFFPL